MLRVIVFTINNNSDERNLNPCVLKKQKQKQKQTNKQKQNETKLGEIK